MKIIDFIEIGTSNFNTIIQTCSDSETGLSIEPIPHYINSLPDKKNVKKINCAVTNNRDCEHVEIYYIPENEILKHNLPLWFRGCNKIGTFHPLHLRHGVQSLVVIEQVKLKNFEEIIFENQIYKSKLIKIDTEGHDCEIMDSIFSFLLKNERDRYPDKIIFETNSNSNVHRVNDVIEKFKNIGYCVVARSQDTILELR